MRWRWWNVQPLALSLPDEERGLICDVECARAKTPAFAAPIHAPTCLLAPPAALVNPLQPEHGGAADAFVAKLNPGGTELVYSKTRLLMLMERVMPVLTFSSTSR